jgi:precorrin-3B methylase
MASLIAVIGDGAGTRAHVGRIISEQEFDAIYIIGEQAYNAQFSASKPFEFIPVQKDESISEMAERIRAALRKKKLGTEVALNFVSGTGKEHMATLSAMLKLGLGVRLIALTKEGVREI